MKKRIGITFIVLVLSISPPLSAQPTWHGMSVYRFCMGDTVLFDGSTCRAYIQGVADAYQHINPANSRSICIPEDKIKREEGEAVVIQWLDFFKERKMEKPIVLISDALKSIFPCKKK